MRIPWHLPFSYAERIVLSTKQASSFCFMDSPDLGHGTGHCPVDGSCFSLQSKYVGRSLFFMLTVTCLHAVTFLTQSLFGIACVARCGIDTYRLFAFRPLVNE